MNRSNCHLGLVMYYEASIDEKPGGNLEYFPVMLNLHLQFCRNGKTHDTNVLEITKK